jgi:putative membrane protein
MNKKFQPIVFAVLVINHVVGLVGLNSPFMAEFEPLSWFNLILSFVLVVSFHRAIDKKFIAFSLLTFLIGMGVEIIGVSTGFPFGQYFYTQQFGPMAFNLTLIIGVNWILLSYCADSIFSPLAISPWFKIFFAANLMTALDLLLEPFSIRHNFWVWFDGVPPVQNFVAWWAVAVFMQWLLHKFLVTVENDLARKYFVLLTVFLLADLILNLFRINLLEPFL